MRNAKHGCIAKAIIVGLMGVLSGCAGSATTCRPVTNPTQEFPGERFDYGIRLKDSNGLPFTITHEDSSEWLCEDDPR